MFPSVMVPPMARKRNRNFQLESSIASQESRIPQIALRAFNNAYQMARASGATVLTVKNRLLLQITQDSEEVLRPIEGYGELKRGTRLQIKKAKT